jgi:anaerobic selenocysteine-containing dehydrogenase
MVDELARLADERADVTGDWPFLLISRRMVEYYNSWGQDLESPRARHGANPAFVHPVDLASVGMVDGDLAVLESEHGAVEVVLASADDVAPGTVSIAHCWGAAAGPDVGAAHGSCVNLLVDNQQPVSSEVGMARQSAVPVRIRPAVPSPAITRR